jgi:catechol 2,3-dioxygenase-like lactoylglutathione lyase family enzyme
MRLLRTLAVFAAMAGACAAQLPDFYKKVGRVTWVVKNIDGPLQGWKALGLTDVQEFGDVTFEGQYRGKEGAGTVRAATGNLGGLAVDLLQPAPGDNAFNAFLAAHGDGILSIVHEVRSVDEMEKEVARMRGLGVAVLQTLRVDGGPVVTYFDTEAQGKYVLGLMYWPGAEVSAATAQTPTHIAFVIRDLAPVSAYWARLGFPAMPASHASPRAGHTYHGKPLALAFDVGWQRHSQPYFEWIIPPQTPSNCYTDTLKAHGEGVHHLGFQVADLAQTTAAYGKLGHQPLQTGGWGEDGQKNSGRYAYMDTDAIGGVTAEVIQVFN